MIAPFFAFFALGTISMIYMLINTEFFLCLLLVIKDCFQVSIYLSKVSTIYQSHIHSNWLEVDIPFESFNQSRYSTA